MGFKLSFRNVFMGGPFTDNKIEHGGLLGCLREDCRYIYICCLGLWSFVLFVFCCGLDFPLLDCGSWYCLIVQMVTGVLLHKIAFLEGN